MPSPITNEDKINTFISQNLLIIGDFKTQKFCQKYFLIFELGKIILIVSPIVLFHAYPFAILIFLNFILFFSIVFLIVIRPYYTKLYFVNSIIIEISTFAAYLGALLIAFQDKQYKSNNLNIINKYGDIIIKAAWVMTFSSSVF